MKRKPVRFVRVAFGAFGALGVLAGCSAVLGIESDRHLVQALDDGGDGGAVEDTAPPPDVYTPPPGWECINDAIPTPNAGDQTLEFVFNDVSSANNGTAGKPIVGAQIRGCTKLDLNCDNPFSPATTDDAGVVDVKAIGGFTGYWEVKAANYSPAILARTRMIGPELAQQSMANISLLTSGGSLAGITQQDNLGIAIVSALNCQSAVAPDIVLEVGAPQKDEKLVYLEDNLPSQAATKTDSKSGSALVFNAPAGTLQISAYFAADHHFITSASALIRIGWVTFVQVRLDQSHRVPLPGQ